MNRRQSTRLVHARGVDKPHGVQRRRRGCRYFVYHLARAQPSGGVTRPETGVFMVPAKKCAFPRNPDVLMRKLDVQDIDSVLDFSVVEIDRAAANAFTAYVNAPDAPGYRPWLLPMAPVTDAEDADSVH